MTKHHNSKACFNGPGNICRAPSASHVSNSLWLQLFSLSKPEAKLAMPQEANDSDGFWGNQFNRLWVKQKHGHTLKTLYETMTKHDRPTMNGQGDTYQHHLPKTARHWWRKPISYQSTQVSGLMSFALHRTMGSMVWGYSGVHDILPWPWPPPPACFFSQGYLDTRSTSASTLYIDIYVCVYPHVSLSNACNYVVAWCCLLFLSWFIHIEVTNQAWTTGTHISNLYKWISVDVKGTVVNSFMPPNCTGTHDLW